MDVSLFDYNLPEQLIAQTPLTDRLASRLMVVDRSTGEVGHHYFRELLSFIKKGDTIVLNDSRVLPARLYGIKEGTGAKIEVLLLKEVPGKPDHWEALVKPGKRVPVGTFISFGDGLLRAECVGTTKAGGRLLHFTYEGIFLEVLEQLGEMPLPPYITERLPEQERYQTVFARYQGSAAAPTAGLHFTQEFLQQLQDAGISIAYVTLHVGLGTFRPVQVDRIEDHDMHAEYYEVSAETAKVIEETRERQGRVIAIGTTTCRTLESVARQHDGKIVQTSGWTDIFIYPGYQFQVIDGLLTNFHLPKSTLMMLVSAFLNREHIIAAYEEAIREQYRFFSFGDAMLII